MAKNAISAGGFMKTKYKIILIYCILLLLAVAIVASGSYIYSKTAPTPEEVRAEFMAGISTAINIAMIAITTRSSINVNPILLLIIAPSACE